MTFPLPNTNENDKDQDFPLNKRCLQSYFDYEKTQQNNNTQYKDLDF